ncbi:MULTISPECIES: type IX secretion system protein PorG [unclassified Myroides]
MNKILISLLVLFTATIAQAQIHEVGLGVGGSNYVGDVGSTKYIDPTNVGFNAFYRWNRSPRHSYKVSISQNKISGNDAKSDMQSRKARGYSFTNTIQQVAVGVEFNFFEFDLHEENFGLTPYLYIGVAGIRYNDLHYRTFEPIESYDPTGIDDLDKLNKKSTDLVRGSKTNSVAIPFAGGIKLRLTSQLNLNAEVAANYTFTDNLDGSHPKQENRKSYSFGKNGNDWFFYSSLTLSYTFGKNPCYCAD